MKFYQNSSALSLRAFENELLKGREITENSVENLYSSKDFRSILNQRVILNTIHRWI